MGSSGGVRKRFIYWAFAAVTLSITLVGLLLALEIGLRIVDWPSPGLYQNGVGPLRLSLPNENGSSWREYPGAARLRHWDYDVAVTLNSHGFIERENRPKQPGEWRIGIFGDSFTAGMGVPRDERFADRWWRDLQRDRPEVSVYNFGSAWSGTAQSAAFLEAHGDEYELDEIVLALFGGNEMSDNVLWEESVDLDPAQRSSLEDRLRDGGWRDRIRNSSRAAGYLYVVLSRGLARRTPSIPTQEDLAKLWPASARALDTLVAAAGSRPLTIWYLPATIEWDDASWQSTRELLDLEPSDRRAVHDAVRDWSTARGIPFLDVTEAFAGQTREALCFPNDGHWNEAGHEIAADYLSRRARLPRSPSAASIDRPLPFEGGSAPVSRAP